jgi:uncharacterized repeat protein (TIGR01451 family)
MSTSTAFVKRAQRAVGQSLALFLGAVLLVVGLPKAAHAAPTATITVTINEISCGSACDEQGIEGIGEGTPDWYAKVFMNNAPANPPRADGPDDTDKIKPDWAFSTVIPDTQQTVPVRIQVWDRDSWDDDLADDTPQPGDKNLDFTIDRVKNNVSGEISGGIGTELCTFGNGEDGDGSAYICFTASTGDRDGDGLQDTWETNGIDFDGNGTIDLALNLPPFNANPDRKDIFVEVDYMACSAGGCAPGDTHSHQPQPGALQDVVDAFAKAPVHNPSGPDGITLHAMEDEAVPEAAQVLFQTNGPGTYDDFNDIKDGNPAGPCTGFFGTAAERANPDCANILGAKRAVFQYNVFGHNYTESPGSSGISELNPKGGNDFMVTLGGFTAGGIAANGGLRASEAATFMHELGHNLSLTHGGGPDAINCKPNYLSLMSYSLQFANIDNTRPLDYSSQALPPLNETALPTSGGVGGPAGRNTVIGQAGNPVVAPADGPIDWDGKGGNKGDVDYIASINPGCQNPTPGETNLVGWDDWSNLVYNFRNSPMYSDGVTRTVPQELTNDEVVAMTPLADLNVAKSVDKANAGPGDTLGYTVTAANAGPGRATGVKVSDSLPDGSVQDRTVGDLAKGASNQQQFSYTIPCSAADGSTVTNTAKVSGTNAALVDDPNQADNTASASTTVHTPKVSLASTASGTVNPGDAITYTLRYENTGSADAANTVVTDTLPADVYYSTGLDTGAGPKPDSVVRNADGSTTLTWHLGSVPASSGARTISFTARPSLLVAAGSLHDGANVSFANANGCSYQGDAVSAATTVTEAPASRDPLSQGYWRNHPGEWTPEMLARIQATDQRFDGADGSTPDGVLSAAEVDSVTVPPGGMPRVTVQQLVATYFNLATHRVNASTAIASKTATRLGLGDVRAAALYARATLAAPPTQATQNRYGDTTTVLDEINNNRSEQY